MAQPNYFKGNDILVKIEDPVTAGTYVASCMINTDRSFTLQAETQSQFIPDCDDPDAPAWRIVDKTGHSATVTGSGIIHRDDMALFDEWVLAEASKECMIEVGGVGGRSYTGQFHCTSLEWTGSGKETATCSITLEQTGPLVPADIA